MTRIILMRHGNTFEEGQTPIQVGARTDLPLTAFGRAQAEKMAEYLRVNRIVPKAIFAGGLKRQTESASIIGKSFGLSFQNTPALTEIDYGLWEGLTADAIETGWPREHAEWNIDAKWQTAIFQGTAEEHREHLQKWFEMLCQKYPNDAVLGVTSNGLLRFFRNEKVKTGHFCEFQGMEIIRWNQNPI